MSKLKCFSGTITYYFISLKRKQFVFSRTPPLLWTLNLLPEAVRNNGSRLWKVKVPGDEILRAVAVQVKQHRAFLGSDMAFRTYWVLKGDM